MKRLYLIILLAAVTLSGMAQNIGEAFYIYRNDGQFNAFNRGEVLSMEFSYDDADGNHFDEIVTQIINTADSVYKIPLAAIDSIGFVQPETIVSHDVFPLTAEHAPYITDGDLLSFKMSASTPEALRPKVGNIVVATADCTAFPNGIIARVESINLSGSALLYTCSQAYYDEVFDQLVVYQSAIDGNVSDAARNFDLRRASLTATLWDLNWSRTIEGGGTTTTLNVGDRATATVIVSKTLTTPLFFQLQLQNDMTSSIGFNATSTASIYKELQIGKTITAGKIAIPYTMGLLWLEPKLSLFGYFEEQGKVELNYGGHFNRTDKVTFTYSERKWSFNHTPLTDVGTDVASLSMEGSAEIGLKPQIDFSLNGQQAGFGLSARAGLKEYINFVFDMTRLSDGGLYDAMRDSYCRTTIPWSITVHANANIFSRYDASQSDDGPATFSHTFAPANEPQWGEDRYIFPLFDNMKGQRQENDKTKADVSATVSRTPLLPVQVGFSLLDKDNKIVQTQYDDRSYQAGSLFDNYTCTLPNLKSNEKYIVRPSVKLFGYDVLATPSTELEEGLIEVKTLDVQDITETSATLFGELSDFDPSMEGKVQFYCGTNSLPQTSAIFDVSQVSGLSSASFSKSISNLKKSTNYYYAAVYNKGGELSYGEIKHFRTKGDLITTGIATDIDTNSAVLHGNVDAPEATEVGIIYAEKSNIDYNNGQRVTATVSGTGDFQISVSGLEEGKTYHYRAYVVGNEGIKYGEVKTFQTTNGSQNSDILYVSNVRRVKRDRQDGGNLLFGFAVTLTGQHENLTSASEYGYYVFNGSSYSYHPVTLGIGGTVEDNVEFSVNRYDFTIRRNFYADVDYYKIGAYIKQGGKVQILNEQKFEQIDYDVAPNITYTSATINYVNFVEEKHATKQCWGDWFMDSDGNQSRIGEFMECKRRIYKVSRSFKIRVEGTFWIEEVRFHSWRTNSETYTCYTADFDWYNEATSDWRVLDYNGEWTFNGMSGNATTTWYPVDKPEPDIYITECCEIKLINGWRGQSSNTVRYTVSSGDGSVTVGPSGGEITFPVDWNIDKYY